MVVESSESCKSLFIIVVDELVMFSLESQYVMSIGIGFS